MLSTLARCRNLELCTPNASRAESNVFWVPPLQDVYCNLGWTLLAADVSGDSEPDLLIGSPFAPGGGKQKGMVAAFYSGSHRSNKGRVPWGRGQRYGSSFCLDTFLYDLFLPYNVTKTFQQCLTDDVGRSSEYTKRDPTSCFRFEGANWLLS